MALLKSAHGGNTREAAALLGIQPRSCSILAPILIRWACLKASTRPDR
ncbi:Uncharacterised protein [Raoultella terrigena]|uniref:Uncharacterized protein n=1 Tax=Raoultella terrigena TaxID=577 RepID=A0A4V6J1U3_RAOTE|nr:Uncharacterised protein [Raoultella terrigena]